MFMHSFTKNRKVAKFVQRIKPLYFCAEKEVAANALLNGFEVSFNDFLYIKDSFINQVSYALNNYSLDKYETKLNILKKHLLMLGKIKFEKHTFQYCSICGEPSKEDVCKACQLIKSFK